MICVVSSVYKVYKNTGGTSIFTSLAHILV